MYKRLTIVSSILLILAGIIIQLLIRDSNTRVDMELVEFFSGIVLGTGLGLPIYLFFGKKKE